MKSRHPIATSMILVFVALSHSSAGNQTESSWSDDPIWHDGKAEWALYDATRVIYGKPRHYEATVFTNKQFMDSVTGVKQVNASIPGVEVFKHNVSEIVKTENYDYRFLTTCFIRTDTLEPLKVVMSSQEDCGTTYKQFTFAGGDHGRVEAVSFCYFPDSGEKRESWNIPGMSKHFRFHDDLTLTLRDFPFDDPESADVMMKMIPDQTENHETPMRFDEAKIVYVGHESLDVPYGRVDTHHLRVEHVEMGGVSESHYWFAADPALRHVLIQYQGPYGVEYRLKRLERWAYWKESKPGTEE